MFGDKKRKLLKEGYKESRNPDVFYKTVGENGKATIHFVNLSTGEEWEKSVSNGEKAREVKVSREVGEVADLYLQCFIAVEEEFPQMRKADTHKVASVLYKGLCTRGRKR